VGDILGELGDDWKAAREWVLTGAKPDVPYPQPLRELARVYEDKGRPSAGRRLRVTAVKQVMKCFPLPNRIIHHLYGLAVGYGFYPLLAMAWLLAIALVAGIIAVTQSGSFAPTDPAAWAPYALVALKALAWLLTVMLLAGLGGFLRRRNT
jgi:hypothetical protein